MSLIEISSIFQMKLFPLGFSSNSPFLTFFLIGLKEFSLSVVHCQEREKGRGETAFVLSAVLLRKISVQVMPFNRCVVKQCLLSVTKKVRFQSGSLHPELHEKPQEKSKE